jgi:hypothetical protein
MKIPHLRVTRTFRKKILSNLYQMKIPHLRVTRTFRKKILSNL